MLAFWEYSRRSEVQLSIVGHRRRHKLCIDVIVRIECGVHGVLNIEAVVVDTAHAEETGIRTRHGGWSEMVTVHLEVCQEILTAR